MPLPGKPNRQPSQNFADVIAQRAQDIRAQPHGKEILQLQSPEQIAEFMSPMMMGVGNLTNITGRGLPQIMSSVTKSQAQRHPSAANWYTETFGPPTQPRNPRWEQILGGKRNMAQVIRDLNPETLKKVEPIFKSKGMDLGVIPGNKIKVNHENKAIALIEQMEDGTFFLSTGGGTFPLNEFLKKKMKAGTIQSKNLEDILQWLADNLK